MELKCHLAAYRKSYLPYNEKLNDLWKKEGIAWAIKEFFRRKTPLEFLPVDWEDAKRQGWSKDKVIGLYLKVDYLNRKLEALQFDDLKEGDELSESLYKKYRTLSAIRLFSSPDYQEAFQLEIPFNKKMNAICGCERPVYITFGKRDSRYFYIGERFFEETQDTTKASFQKRIPLFRARRLDTHKWIEGMPFYYSGGQTGIIQQRKETKLCDKGNKDGYCDLTDLFCPKVDPNTVCEWTGLYDGTAWEALSPDEQKEFLLDHNKEEWQGKKIFEGDIVSFKKALNPHCDKFIVVFNDDRFTCMNFSRSLFDDPTDAFSEGTEDFRVVGSIYD